MTNEPGGATDTREFRQARFAPPPGATEVILVRHGESAPARPDEPFALVDGHGDPPLDPVGHDQARAVGRRLATEPIDAIYVTTLQRTHQTAAPLVAAVGLETRVEPDLREVFLGEWEGGALRKHMADGHPLAQELIRTGDWGVIPGGEPLVEFQARCVRALERIHGDHPDERVACFVHGGVIAALVGRAAAASPIAFRGADNGSIHHLVLVGDHWILRRFNDTAHLGPIVVAAQAQI